jgi:hypothetical protein
VKCLPCNKPKSCLWHVICTTGLQANQAPLLSPMRMGICIHQPSSMHQHPCCNGPGTPSSASQYMLPAVAPSAAGSVSSQSALSRLSVTLVRTPRTTTCPVGSNTSWAHTAQAGVVHGAPRQHVGWCSVTGSTSANARRCHIIQLRCRRGGSCRRRPVPRHVCRASTRSAPPRASPAGPQAQAAAAGRGAEGAELHHVHVKCYSYHGMCGCKSQNMW